MAVSAPLIVVGSGIAGLTVALSAAPRPVLLLARAPDGADSASALAQGGIAAATSPDDSAERHARDTCMAGAEHNDTTAVRHLTDGAIRAIEWLQAQGVRFDRDARRRLQLGREGGHDCARIVHAGGDASGAALVAALTASARRATHIEWRSGLEVDGLLLRGGRAAGVCVRDGAGTQEILEGNGVVLATGGIGALFSRTSNPMGANGAGLALALAAGAVPRDLEFVQFHPTALDIAGTASLPLLTEALRGQGARLIDDRGDALMQGAHPLGDLAPRDVVARRVWLAQRDGGRVWLDARHLGDGWPHQFPTVLASCHAHGIDPRDSAIPVTPAAHFHMGGVATDCEGNTSVPGLYAVGEVACNGVHGANRLASNSLLEGVVFGRRLGTRLAAHVAPSGSDRTFRLIERGVGLPGAQLVQLRELMWNAMGPVRTAALLEVALRESDALARMGWQGGVARALLAAALRRRSSLGAHYRHEARIGAAGLRSMYRAA